MANEDRIQVLLVEDSPSDAQLLCEFLQEYPPQRFALERVERLEEALRLVADRAFDVVLLDLTLPDSTGLETCTRMRRAAPRLPIVVLTGVDDETIALEAMHRGVEDYLVKGQIHGATVGRAIRYAVERRRSESALRESEQRYRTLFSTMSEGFAHHEIVCDPEGRPCDYRFLEVNPAFERQTGLKSAELVGRTVREVLPGIEPVWIERYGRVALTGQPEQFEARAEPLGRWYDVRAYQTFPGCFGVVFTDVTERKRAEKALYEAHHRLQLQAEELQTANEELRTQAEELQASNEELREQELALRESEERFRATYEQAAIGIEMLSLEGWHLRGNGALCRILGYSQSELQQRRFSDITHPEDLPRERRLLDDLLAGRIPNYTIEKRYLHKDGHSVWVRVTSSLARVAEPYRISIIEDITERKHAEEQLARRNRTLRALSNSSQALMHATEETAYLQEVCKIVVEDCGHVMVWIGYAEEDEAKSVRPVAHAGLEEGYLETLQLTWADTERGRGPTGTAIRTGQPRMCRNMLTDPDFAPWRDQAVKRGYASSIVFPLLAGGKAFGAITIYAKEPDPFSKDEVELLTELAADLAYGITFLRLRAAHAQMEADLRRLNDQLEQEVQTQTEELKDTVDRLQNEVARRVLAEGRLRRRSQMLEAFFQHTIAPLAFLDRDFNFVRVNAAYARADGKEPEYFVGKNHFALYPQDENRTLFEQVVRTKQPYFAHARPFTYPDAPQRVTYWDWQLTPLLDERGDVQFLVLNSEEVTEQQTAFQELEHRARLLQKLTLELSQAEDRERKRLAEILHDDLQQQLAAAKFHLSLLNNRVPQDPAAHKILAQLDQILKDSIEKSRSLSHELSPALLYQGDLGETFEWMARELKAKHGLTVHVENRDRIESAPEALKVFLYRTAQEILFNVVKHARVKETRLRLQRLRGGVWLTISDQGQGFDPRSLGKTGGFGLLSIRERIELLGGRMKIRSAPGRGSTFLIVLPDGRPPEDRGPRAEDGRLKVDGSTIPRRLSSVLRPPSSALRVLLADDHKVMREGLAALLNEQPDVEVVGQAGNGREAVDLAYQLGPDVVVMDVSMPMMAGDEATRQIKQRLPKARIVALSMFEEADMAEAMHQAGAEAYLLKTAPSHELLAAIRGRKV